MSVRETGEEQAVHAESAPLQPSTFDLQPAQPARRSLPLRELAFIGTVLAVVGLDQWTKQLARQHLLDDGLPRTIPVVGDWLKLTYVENRGAAFGLLQNQTLFFVIVGVVVIGVIIASYRQMARPSVLLNLCLGLQMGGAIGNLIDRVKDGYVVDFMELPYWPVFNVADSAIVVGVAGLAFKMLFPRAGAEEHGV